MARKRFQEGVAAVDSGNYEAARVAFQQAYALKPHASVLRNLGQAELKTAHYLEAARHLSAFIRDTTFGTAAERESAKKALTQAESKIAKLAIEVDIDGAEITVDGELAGRSPLGPDPYYSEPGQRAVKISKDGFLPYEQTHTLEPGRTQQLKIVLRKPAPAAVLSPPAPSDAADVVPPPNSGALDTVTSGLDVAPPGSAPIAPAGSATMGKGTTVALIVLGGATAISAGVAIGFSLRGAALHADEDETRHDLGVRYPGSPCPAAGVDCQTLEGLASDRADAFKIARVGMIATAASLVAGVVVFVAGRSTRTTALPTVVPVLTGEQRGLGIAGSF